MTIKARNTISIFRIFLTVSPFLGYKTKKHYEFIFSKLCYFVILIIAAIEAAIPAMPLPRPIQR